MAYDPSDLRSQLASASRVAGANVPAQYFELAQLPPTEHTPAGSPTWWLRSQSCCVALTQLAAGDALHTEDQPDEHMVLCPDPATDLRFDTGTDRGRLIGDGLAIVPPGSCTVTAATPALVARVFTTVNPALTARCTNDWFYETPDHQVAPYAPWPDPPGGFRLRIHPMSEVPRDPARFGRLFRCSTLMVNFFAAEPGPRDPSKLSPHHHDDFEQLSLCVLGDYVHHIRTPWTPNQAAWRDDEHRFVASPSLTVIPPPAIHTSQGVGEGAHQLLDIFCPPRRDFSERPGWVLNADDYPMPLS